MSLQGRNQKFLPGGPPIVLKIADTKSTGTFLPGGRTRPHAGYGPVSLMNLDTVFFLLSICNICYILAPGGALAVFPHPSAPAMEL